MSNLQDSIKSLLDSLDGFVTNKTVVSQPIEMSDATIIPLMEISLGVGAGAFDNSDKNADKQSAMATAGGMGAKMSPSAILIVHKDGSVRLVNVKNQDPITKLIDTVPDLMDTIKNVIKKESPDVEEKVNEVIN